MSVIFEDSLARDAPSTIIGNGWEEIRESIDPEAERTLGGEEGAGVRVCDGLTTPNGWTVSGITRPSLFSEFNRYMTIEVKAQEPVEGIVNAFILPFYGSPTNAFGVAFCPDKLYILEMKPAQRGFTSFEITTLQRLRHFFLPIEITCLDNKMYVFIQAEEYPPITVPPAYRGLNGVGLLGVRPNYNQWLNYRNFRAESRRAIQNQNAHCLRRRKCAYKRHVDADTFSG